MSQLKLVLDSTQIPGLRQEYVRSDIRLQLLPKLHVFSASELSFIIDII